MVEVDDDANPATALVVESETSTVYLNDPYNHTGYSQVLEETTTDVTTGQVTETKVFTIGHDVIAQTTFDAGGPAEGTTYTLLYDGHGSTRILTDALAAIATDAGGIEQIYNYDAYGNAIGFAAAAALTALLYSGEQFDSRINQQYLRARYYNPATGTFNRLDPYSGNLRDPQSLHKYLYTHGDPVNGVDPSGRIFSTIGSIIVSGIQSIGRALKQGANFVALNFARITIYASSAFAAARTLIARSGQAISSTFSRFGTQISNFFQMLGRSPAYARQALRAAYEKSSIQITRIIQSSETLKYYYRVLVESFPRFVIPSHWRFSQSAYNNLVGKNVIVGRFYQVTPLQKFADRFVNAVTYEGRLGVGRHLINNIHKLMQTAPTIYVRAKGALDPRFFTYVNEITHIAKNPSLYSKAWVLLENGQMMTFYQWATNNGLWRRVL